MFAPLIKATNPKTASQAVATRPAKGPQVTSWPAILGIGSPGLVEPKLRIGTVNDPFEDEADRMADHVMRIPETAVRVRKSAAMEPAVQHLCSECEEEAQRKNIGVPASVGGPAGSAAENAIRSLAGGFPLSTSERAYFEPRFGTNFSTVRLHDDTAAGAAARSIGARAFTLESHVAFAPGEYAPGTAQGRQLLAHELSHVVQQADAPRAYTVMRKSHTDCDRRTTGLDDADARIDRARVEALRIMSVASASFPRMNTRTIRLVDRHFHCPSSSQIVMIMAALDTIARTIPSEVRCLGGSTKECRGISSAWAYSDGLLGLCPSAFPEEFKEQLGGVAGLFIWAAAANAGFDNLCDWLSFCYNDFTVPASDMMKHMGPYRHFALDLAGYRHREPSTIPCGVQSTGIYVSIPPGALRHQIRPITGHETPPQGSEILTVHEDRAGNKFIYHDDMMDAQVYLPNEPKRLYFDPRIFAAATEADVEKMLEETNRPEKRK